jgi:hypothetical protein
MPRYLYRVVYPGSAGVNEEGLYQAGSVKAGLGKSNFFDADNEHIKDTLREHLMKSTKSWSPWISFSDSLVATLAKALRFQYRGTKSGEVQIHVIDTLKIKK